MSSISSPFSSFFSSNNGTSSLLTDYMTIKSGTYKKLLKAQYKNEKEAASGSSSSSKSTLSSAQKNELVDAKSDADALKSAASKLVTTGSKSLFNKVTKEVKDEETGEVKTVEDYDRDAIVNAIKKFAESYNEVVKSSLSPSNAQMTKKAAVMINSTKMNKSSLSDIGITVGADYKLTIDEEKLKKADMGTVKSIFNGTGSFASQVSTRASDLSNIASKIITSEKSGYNSAGRYSSSYSSGSLFNGFF